MRQDMRQDMKMEKIKIDFPVIVEGKYDKNTLSQIIDAQILPIGGFSVFNSKELRSLISRMAEKSSIILLTDSDGGGVQIRSFIESFLPKDRIINLYIPKIPGKEKRKKKGGRSKLLGVEGMPPEMLRNLFLPLSTDTNRELKSKRKITKTDFFSDGLSGSTGSSEKRRMLAEAFSMPGDISANALLSALNIICSYEEYKDTVDRINSSFCCHNC